MRSLQYYLSEEVVQRETMNIAGRIVVTPEEEAADLERCRRINDKWNAKCAAKRDERLAVERAENRKTILANLEARELLDAEKFDLTENMVRHEKVGSVCALSGRLECDMTFQFIYFRNNLKPSYYRIKLMKLSKKHWPIQPISILLSI